MAVCTANNDMPVSFNNHFKKYFHGYAPECIPSNVSSEGNQTLEF